MTKTAPVEPANNRDAIVGMPPFANNDRYDVTAKIPSGGPQLTMMDQEALAPMIRHRDKRCRPALWRPPWHSVSLFEDPSTPTKWLCPKESFGRP